MTLTKSGELLKEARLKKHLTFEDVEKATKIRVKFLRALEEGGVGVFHSTAYARGFLKNYAEFLGLDLQVILAVFRRETSSPHVKVLPQGMVEDVPWFRITPRRTTIAIILIILVSIGYFLFQEYRGFLGAPKLSVEKPEEEEIVKEGEIEVAGKADSDSTVLVNGEAAAILGNGRFAKKIQVFKGEATLTIIAQNRRGKETTVTRRVKVE